MLSYNRKPPEPIEDVVTTHPDSINLFHLLLEIPEQNNLNN